jgi:hypothetical protein
MPTINGETVEILLSPAQVRRRISRRQLRKMFADKVKKELLEKLKGESIMEKIAILTSDRYFVKLVEGEEIPVKAEELVEGDIFSLYSDSSKQTKCHWGETNVFKCEGPVFNNEEEVQYIPCSLK